MGKKKGNEKQASENNLKLSGERMIEIHAEAYYRALKRLEQERDKKEEKQKRKWNENVFLLLNILFCPWKISKSFKINKQIYDNILVVVVSEMLIIFGTLTWLLGSIKAACGIIGMVKGSFSNAIMNFSIGACSWILGSMFILAGSEFEKESDSNKIYAYSACILALVSCVVSIIALLVNR